MVLLKLSSIILILVHVLVNEGKEVERRRKRDIQDDLDSIKDDIRDVEGKVDLILDFLNITTTPVTQSISTTPLIQSTTNLVTQSTTTPVTQSTQSTTTELIHECSKDYEEYEGHCYYFSWEKMEWSYARKACQDKGGYLVSVNTREEHDFIVDSLPRDETGRHAAYWLGLTQAPPGPVMWLDGTTVTFDAWGAYDPGCLPWCRAALKYGYRGTSDWEDISRDYDRNYICEMEMNPKPSAATSTQTECPPGHSRFEDHCYMFELVWSTWSEAKDVCEGQGDYLLSINSRAERDFIASELNNHYNRNAKGYWIGISYDEGRLVWEDGSELSYSDWVTNQPNCMTNGCHVMLDGDSPYKWKEGDAERRNKYYICERNM